MSEPWTYIEVWERVNYREGCECGRHLIARTSSRFRGGFYEWAKVLPLLAEKAKRRRFHILTFNESRWGKRMRVVQVRIGYPRDAKATH